MVPRSKFASCSFSSRCPQNGKLEGGDGLRGGGGKALLVVPLGILLGVGAVFGVFYWFKSLSSLRAFDRCGFRCDRSINRISALKIIDPRRYREESYGGCEVAPKALSMEVVVGEAPGVDWHGARRCQAPSRPRCAR
ncbi:hypothetical protein BDZ91DRAFT_563262 [Kalaharituber pfeilii]|nr:hypothetical protein BDZ91DRAFT_563262 [Kalaharituber pfeilii]